MPNILILGGGAAGLAAALAAAQSAPAAQVIVLERNPKPGKKLLATGNGRCNLDNTGIAPELYFTADPAALRPLLDAVNTADPLRWFHALGLYTRTDEAGRRIRTPSQAADVLALLEHHLAQHHVQLRTGCTVRTLNQSRSGYAVQFETAGGSAETLRADAVICAMGGEAGPQFGTDGFGTRFAAQCGGRVEPLYPCLTALQCAKPRKALAGIRAKAAGSPCWTVPMCLPARTARYSSPITAFPASASCSCPACWPRAAAPRLLLWSWTLFPAVDETALASLFAAPRRPDGRGQRR